jgi:hypothetical protein
VCNQSPKNARAVEIVVMRDEYLERSGFLLFFNTVKALWTSYGTLHCHFRISCEDPDLKYTFIGLKEMLESQ